MLLACQQKQQVKEKQYDASNVSLQSIHSNTKMVYIPGGEYMPFYGAIDSNEVSVSPFLIDENAVTNREFLEFVKANPQWRRSNISRIYADSSYLKEWVSDLELPKNAKPDAPVTYVSWFAAKAYAKSVGKRLPTLDEWEFLAMADTDTSNARDKKSYSAAIIDLYLQKDRQYNAVKKSKPNYWKVYNMFDLIWEWTDDFNSILTIGDSRTGTNEDKSLFCAAGGSNATDVNNYAAYMRFAMRTAIKANFSIANLGFRCAKDTLVEPKLK
jgi:formylglycine-generating enzyme required for sulfatase activity